MNSVRVLLLCQANVCRSPTMAHLLGTRLREWGCDGVELQTAGTAAVAGQQWCPRARRYAERAVGRTDRPVHSSRPCTPHLIDAADLIVAADVRTLNDATRMLVTARPRIFTLAEIGVLGDEATAPEQSAGGRTGDVGGFADVVDEMNALRGRVSPPEYLRVAGWRRRRTAWSLDVADAHAQDGISHRSMLPLLEELVNRAVDPFTTPAIT